MKGCSEWLNIKDNLESIIIITMDSINVYFKFKDDVYLYKVGVGKFNQWPTNIPSTKQLTSVEIKIVHVIMKVKLYDLKYHNRDCFKSIAKWKPVGKIEY